jgi:hypothetical protein
MGYRNVIAATLGVLLTGLILGGCCKKKPGDSCTGADPSCLDESNLLACEKGTFISTPCKGPNGCKVEDNLLTCDISGNTAGDPCATADEGDAACSVDKKSQVACKGGKYEVAQCRGPNGCRTEGNTSICDLSISEENDDCSAPGAANTFACSVDGTKVLKCKGGKFQLSSHCRGKKCEVKGDEVGCPDPIALVGDPCEATSSGSYACAVDGTALLVCRGLKWNVDEKCRGKSTCKQQGDKVGCL